MTDWIRCLCLVLSTTAAGMILGGIDAIDTILGGFASGLDLLDLIVVGGTSAMAVGMVGVATGVGAAITMSVARRCGVRWSFDELRVGGRTVLESRGAVAVAVAIGFGGVAMLLFGLWWLLIGTGSGVLVMAGLIAVAGVVGTIGLAIVLSRSFCPQWVNPALWVLSIIGAYIIETRLLYMFSRASRLGVAHAVLLPAFILLLGIGLLRFSPRLCRGWRDRWRVALSWLLLTVVVFAALLVAVESFCSHRVRLVLHDRVSLAFRPLGAIPMVAIRRSKALQASWRSECQLSDLQPSSIQPSSATAPKSVKSKSVRAAEVSPLRGVVMVLIDSVRSDRVETKRHGEFLMPNLRRLLDRATYFPNTYSTAPGTTKAIASLLASRYFDNIDSEQMGHSLGGALADAGIKTIAVSGHPNLARSTSHFDVLDDSASIEHFELHKNALTSEAIIARAFVQLRQLEPDERFFLLVHMFDPHAHYVSNPLYDFGRSEQDRYDAEIKYTDYWLGKFLAELRSHQDTGVVIMSDHGDEFWEHRYKRHQVRLYEESARVLLAIADPRYSHSSVSEKDVSILDVAPTILAMMGLSASASRRAMRGHSLWPVVSGIGALPSYPVFLQSTNRSKSAVVLERSKLIFDRRTGVAEFYDLHADPGEAINLADHPSQRLKDLSCRLGQWMNNQN